MEFSSGVIVNLGIVLGTKFISKVAMIRERPNLKNAFVYTVGPKQSKMSYISYYNAHYITVKDVCCSKQLML